MPVSYPAIDREAVIRYVRSSCLFSHGYVMGQVCRIDKRFSLIAQRTWDSMLHTEPVQYSLPAYVTGEAEHTFYWDPRGASWISRPF